MVAVVIVLEVKMLVEKLTGHDCSSCCTTAAVFLRWILFMDFFLRCFVNPIKAIATAELAAVVAVSYCVWFAVCCIWLMAISCLCSRAICRLTVLFRVNVREQKGQGTRIPWWRCRIWARKLVSYPYKRSQYRHLSFFPKNEIMLKKFIE